MRKRINLSLDPDTIYKGQVWAAVEGMSFSAWLDKLVAEKVAVFEAERGKPYET